MNSKKESQGPLYGLRVVDITDIRGALCARLLADLGADVLRVPLCEEDSKDSFAHKFRNANKRSLSSQPNIFNKDGKPHQFIEMIGEVASHADVLIENLGPKLLGQCGFINLFEQFQNLIHISISDFGLSGPHSNWRLEPLPAFSSSGGQEVSGFPDLPPCWLPGFMAHDSASVFGAVAAVAAIMDRRRIDSGQMVEVSVQEASLNSLNPWSVIYESYSSQNTNLPVLGGRFADSTYWVLAAKDGWVRTVLGTDAHWNGFLKTIGDPEALSAPEWTNYGFRAQNSDVARLVANPILSQHTKTELFEMSIQNGTMLGPIHTLQEFMEHPQTQYREFFTTTGWEGMEGVSMPTVPWKLEKSPASLRMRAPLPAQQVAPSNSTHWLDEDDENFCPINGPKFSNFKPAAKPHNLKAKIKTQLLDGIRVIEFGTAAVVPELCWILTEFGAEVIKLESRVHPDVLRLSGSGNLDARFAFNAECRGRKSVALDLSTKRGREIAFQLCESADIVAENFRGKSLEKMGLSYEALSANRPELIYISSQGYGRGGPMGDVTAFGPINSAFSGIHLLWNHSEKDIEGRYPCGTSLNHPDHIVGKLLAIPVLAAIDYRARTGQGQLIDMSQAEAGAYFMGHFYMEGNHQPNGNRNEGIVPHDTYPCADFEVKGDTGDDSGSIQTDNWVSIVAKTDEEFSNLSQVIDANPAPAKWEKAAERLKHREEIDVWISSWTKALPPMDTVKILQAGGVSAMMVQGPRDHHTDPHLKERNSIIEIDHPVVGPELHTANPMRMSKTHLEPAGHSPCLGADTEEVLSGVLNLSPTQIQDLISDKICY